MMRGLVTTAWLTNAVLAKDAVGNSLRGNNDKKDGEHRELQPGWGGGFGGGNGGGGFGGGGFGGGGFPGFGNINIPDINIPDINIPTFGDVTDTINQIVDSLPRPEDLDLPELPDMSNLPDIPDFLPDVPGNVVTPTLPATPAQLVELAAKEPADCRYLSVVNATIASTLMTQQDGLDCVLFKFAALGRTQSQFASRMQGEYRPIFLWIDGEFSQIVDTLEEGIGNLTNPNNPTDNLEGIVAENTLTNEEFAQAVVWKGFSCNDGVCSVRNRGVPFDQLTDAGRVEYQRRCGLGGDFAPCLKIDFTQSVSNPRVVYGRVFDKDKILAVVKSDYYGYDAAPAFDYVDADSYKNGVQDVKVLNYTGPYDPPVDFTLPNVTNLVPNPVDLVPDVSPDDCAGLPLLNATVLANILNKENGRECVVAFFASLGPDQRLGELSGVLQGRYESAYRWSDGAFGSGATVAAGVRWGGLDCVGRSCDWLNVFSNAVGAPADVVVEDVCPIGSDPFPCLRLDFTGDETHDQILYARVVNPATIASLSLPYAGADWRETTALSVLSQGTD